MHKKSAFLYKHKYYLVPDEFADFGEYQKEMARRLEENKKNRKRTVKTEAVCLVEKKCLVPYFVEEYTKSIKLSIHNTEDMYPFEAELMSMQEYYERLQKVARSHCSGCIRSFSGGTMKCCHDNMSLDGVCFARCEEGDYLYTMPVGIKEFINDFMMAKGYIESLVDNGKNEKAANEIRDIIDSDVMPMTALLFTAKSEERYICVFSGGGDLCMNHLLEEFCSLTGRLTNDTNWVFLPFIPKGFMDYLGFETKTPRFDFSVYGIIDPEIFMEVEKEDYNILSYLAFCNTLGENCFQNLITRVRAVDKLEKTSDMEQLETCMEHIMRETEIEQSSFPPRELYPVKRDGTFWMRYNFIGELAEIIEEHPEDIRKNHNLVSIGVSFGVLTMQWDDEDNEDWHMSKILDVFENPQYSDFFTYVTLTHSYDRCEFNLMFFDYRTVLPYLRSLSPMFERYNTSLKMIYGNKPSEEFRLCFRMDEIL